MHRLTREFSFTYIVLHYLNCCRPVNDTLLLKQKNLPLLENAGFFFRMSTNAENKHAISNSGDLFSFNNNVSNMYNNDML